MSDAYRTVGNPGTGETITFLETSEESGGARVVALITLAPGGAVTPHSHRIRETFECVEGAFTVHLGGRDMRFPPGESMVADPQQLHGFRNDTDVAATLKVTATPAGDLDRVLRTLCGLGRDGVLVPGKPPRHPLVMANLAYRGRCYSPPLPRWLYWTLIGGMSPFGARACDRIMALQPGTGTDESDRTLSGKYPRPGSCVTTPPPHDQQVERQPARTGTTQWYVASAAQPPPGSRDYRDGRGVRQKRRIRLHANAGT